MKIECNKFNPSMISRSLPPKAIEYKDQEYHIILRPFNEDDTKKMEEVLEKTLPYLQQWMSGFDKNWDYQACLEWIIKCHAEYFSGTVFEWGIFDKNSSELLGCVGIICATPFNPDCWEIAYWTSENHMKKGIATLSTQIVTAVSFLCLQVKRMQVGCVSDNIASKGVIAKCEFKFEGSFIGLYANVGVKNENTTADLLYSLLPQDTRNLSWYKTILNHTSIIALDNKIYQLHDIYNYNNLNLGKDVILRNKNESDISWIKDLMTKDWGGEPLVVRAKKYYPTLLDGIIAVDKNNKIIGFLFYEIYDNNCEIIVFEVFNKFKGIGTLILDKLKKLAKNNKCRRIFLMTTNDNLDGLCFYQKRGFHICGIHIDSIANSRKLKDTIGFTGDFGIPLRDEIDLEWIVE